MPGCDARARIDVRCRADPDAGSRATRLARGHGILAPRATPKEIVVRLNPAIVKILARVRKRELSSGLDPMRTPEHFGAYIRSEIAKGRSSEIVRARAEDT